MDTSIPTWLATLTPTAPDTPLLEYPTTRTELTLKELTFENFFERALDGIVEGRTIKSLILDDNRDISESQFMRWIKKDTNRFKRYQEALEIKAEIMLHDLVPTAQGTDMSEVERDKLILTAMMKSMSFMSPNRFGKDTSTTTGSSMPVINISFSNVESPYITATTGGDKQAVIDV
jgi:hypothetical protein